MRLLECPWLQQQHKSSVESCIRTLAMVGKEPPLCPGDRGQGTEPPWAVSAQQRAGHAVPPVGVAGHHGEELPPGHGHVQLQDVLFI